MLGNMLLIALIVIFSVFILLSFLVTIITYYRRVECFVSTPENYNITAETINVNSLDGIPLKAWWVKPELQNKQKPIGVIILLHGMKNMDASSLLGHTTFLSKAGYHSIVLDMRSHGRSGGNRICLAIKETKDVIPILDWIQEQSNIKDIPLILWGFSLGAATAIRTAAIRPDVDAVISVSSYAAIDLLIYDQLKTSQTVKVFMDIYISFVQFAIWILYGRWAIKASPIKDIKKISPRPIMIAHGSADSEVSIKHARMLLSSVGVNSHSWLVEGKGHCIFTGDATGDDNKDYRRIMLDFLSHIKRKKKKE